MLVLTIPEFLFVSNNNISDVIIVLQYILAFIEYVVTHHFLFQDIRPQSLSLHVPNLKKPKKALCSCLNYVTQFRIIKGTVRDLRKSLVQCDVHSRVSSVVRAGCSRLHSIRFETHQGLREHNFKT